MKNYKRAAENFERALLFETDNKTTINYLGLCLNSQGDTKGAIKQHKRALKIDPNYKECWSNLGQAYKERGNYQKSEDAYSKSILMDTSHENTYYLRGFARFSSGKKKKLLLLLFFFFFYLFFCIFFFLTKIFLYRN